MLMMPMMFIGPLLWIAAIGLIVWAVTAALGRNIRSRQSGDSALDVLKKSYARGGIDKAEFETKKKGLA